MDNFVKINLDSLKVKRESCYIYKILCTSRSLYNKSYDLECLRTQQCLDHNLAVLLNDALCLPTGSRAEGTNLPPSDYNTSFRHTLPSSCFSDTDTMDVLYHVRVIEEGEALPQQFDNYMYCMAERGRHTRDGYRKVKVIHSPKHYLVIQDKAWIWAQTINASVEDGYINSSTFLAILVASEVNIPWKHSIQNAFSSKGPSNIIDQDGSASDFVRCFFVKTWPQEAKSWFTRHTHWPDKQLKSKIKKIGYLLVPTGNRKSEESSLEWRCSFSIAEELLFKSKTKFQRYTFVVLKVLLKEYIPPDINTNGVKQLLSTYHIKTLFLWCLEDSKLKWEPENMLEIIHHMLDVLTKLIKQEKFPHYFITSVNLFDGRRLHGRKKNLKRLISFIKNDLSNKIRCSEFFRSQEISASISLKRTSEATFKINLEDQLVNTCKDVMDELNGRLQCCMQTRVFSKIDCFSEVKLLSYPQLIQLLISMNHEIDPQVVHLYTSIFSDSFHKKLVKKVIPGLIDQYRGCIHLAQFCMNERDGRVFPNTLLKAESLLKETLHLDPCSGYVKLAFLYIATGDFVQAMDQLDVAENNMRMLVSARKASRHEGVELDRINTVYINEVFQEWTEGKVASNIVVTWPEYNIVPALLQFELIHESTQQVIDVLTGLQGTVKMVALDCHLQWSPLSMITFIKFVCALNTAKPSTSHLENLVADLVDSSQSTCLNDAHSVFNMASWCYLKIKKYRQAVYMMKLANLTRLNADVCANLSKNCAFFHYFLSYVIAQCLL